MFKGFFSAAAFEERARVRERRKLVKELEEIDKQRRYMDGREPVILARLNVLSGQDLAQWLEQLRTSGGAGFIGRSADSTTWSPHRQAYEAIGAKQ